MRQVADEADGIGEQRVARIREIQTAHRRIERCEELVGRIRLRPRQPIEQRRLAGVRVPDECDGRNRRALALAACRLALGHDFIEAAVQCLDPVAEQAAVRFELSFTRTAKSDTALLALQVSPSPDEPRCEMLELRELHLKLAFEAPRALREDVENESGAIEHTAFEERLEVALLTRRERMIEHHEIRRERADLLADLFCLAAADEQTRIRCATCARHESEHIGTGRTRERVELAQLVLTRRSSQTNTH